MKKGLSAIPLEERTSAQIATLEVLEDCADLVEGLRNGDPIWDMRARVFIDDINQNWSWYMEDEKMRTTR